MVGIPEDEAQGYPLGYTHTCIETDRQTDRVGRGGEEREQEQRDGKEEEEGGRETERQRISEFV